MTKSHVLGCLKIALGSLTPFDILNAVLPNNRTLQLNPLLFLTTWPEFGINSPLHFWWRLQLCNGHFAKF